MTRMTLTKKKRKRTKKAKMNNVTLYLYFGEEVVDRPLSRVLRDRAAALSFGEDGFDYAETASTEKPRFFRPDGAFFNVTHAENLFLCAIGDCEVGLDAELFPSQLGRREKIAARVFSEDELATLAPLDEEEYKRAFTLLWTKAEAAAKFSGEGLAALLKREEADLVYTDLTPILKSLGIPAAATLATRDVAKLTLVLLEDE